MLKPLKYTLLMGTLYMVCGPYLKKVLFKFHKHKLTLNTPKTTLDLSTHDPTLMNCVIVTSGI